MFTAREIVPGQGIGKLELGLLIDEVKKILGEPNEIEDYELEDDMPSQFYYYDDLGLVLSFEDEELVEISIESEEYHIKNLIRVGDPISKVIDNKEKLGLTEYEVEETDEEELEAQSLYSFEVENVHFWIVDNIIQEINIGIV